MINIHVKLELFNHSTLIDILLAFAFVWLLFDWTLCFNNFTHNDDKETAIFIFIIFFAAPVVLALTLCVFSIYMPTETI